MTNTTQLPICLYQRCVKKKQPEIISQKKRLFIPFFNTFGWGWMSPFDFHLCHFRWSQLERYQLVAGRNEWFTGESLLSYSPKILLLILSCPREICIGIRASSPVTMTTAVFVVSHLLYYTSRKAPGGLSVLLWRISARKWPVIVRVKNEPPAFHLRQVPVMFGLHKRPRRSDPRFNRGHRSHTSSISGDHRALLPPAGLLAAVWWMDRGRRRLTLWGRAEVAPHCCLWNTVPQSLANQLRQIYGTTTLSPQTALWQARPPTLPLCLPLCAPWPCAALWPGSNGEECTKLTREEEEEEWEHSSLTHSLAKYMCMRKS